MLHKRKEDDNRNKSLVKINDQCLSMIQIALIKFDGIGGEKGLNSTHGGSLLLLPVVLILKRL